MSDIINNKISRIKSYLKDIKKINEDRALMQINLCVSRVCKRSCICCPQNNKEKNEEILQKKPSFMDYKIISRIAVEAYQKNFKGIFAFNGMGEPTENDQLPYMCKTIRMYCPTAKIQIVTNGDNENIIKEIDKKVKNVLFIFSEYSIEDSRRNKILYKDIKNKEFRKLYTKENILLLNNRAKNINFGSKEIPFDCCSKPFFSTSVDTDGALLICNNDWYGINPYGHINTDETHSKLWIQWKEKLKKLRMIMLLNDRIGCEYPCCECNEIKRDAGKEFIRFWKWKYAKDFITEKIKRFICKFNKNNK